MDTNTRKRLTICRVFQKKGSVARLFLKQNDDRAIGLFK